LKLLEPQVLIIILIIVLLLAIPYWFSWRILGKAGYNQWLSLVVFIPYGVLVVAGILAFGDWPVFRTASDAMQAVAPVPLVAPGWLADPTGRFELRYWDGSRWTQSVVTGGVSSSDPI